MVIVAHSLIVKKQTLTNGLRKQYATPISYLQFYFIALGISSSIQTKFARLHFAYPCLQSSASWRQMPGSNGGLVGERRGSRLCKPAFAPREAFQGKRIAEKKKRRERELSTADYTRQRKMDSVTSIATQAMKKENRKRFRWRQLELHRLRCLAVCF